MPPEAAELQNDDVLEVEVNDDGQANDNQDVAEPSEAERVASLMGWKADFNGPGKKTAEEFLVAFPDVLRNANNKNKHLESQLARVVGEVAKLSAMQKRTMDAQQEAALSAAVEANDFEGVKKVVAAIKETAEGGQGDALTEFKSRNDWFDSDPEATAYAMSLDAMYARQSGGKILDAAAHMKRVEDGVKKKFPELFGEAPEPKGDAKPAPRAPLISGGGRVSRPNNGEITVATMTAAHKAAARECQVTDEAYVRSFNKTIKRAS